MTVDQRKGSSGTWWRSIITESCPWAAGMDVDNTVSTAPTPWVSLIVRVTSSGSTTAPSVSTTTSCFRGGDSLFLPQRHTLGTYEHRDTDEEPN